MQQCQGAVLMYRSPRMMTPPHRICRDEQFRRLCASMTRHGWRGRPLLALPTTGRRAITGSHRIAAARRVQLERIPVFVLTPTVWRFMQAAWAVEYRKPYHRGFEVFYQHFTAGALWRGGYHRLAHILRYDWSCCDRCDQRLGDNCLSTS